MYFTSQVKKEMCTSVVIRCPQNVHNCDSFNSLYKMYDTEMEKMWPLSSPNLQYRTICTRNLRTKPPSKIVQLLTEFEPGLPEYDAGGTNLFIQAHELQLSHETVLPQPSSKTPGPQNANN